MTRPTSCSATRNSSIETTSPDVSSTSTSFGFFTKLPRPKLKELDAEALHVEQCLFHRNSDRLWQPPVLLNSSEEGEAVPSTAVDKLQRNLADANLYLRTRGK